MSNEDSNNSFRHANLIVSKLNSIDSKVILADTEKAFVLPHILCNLILSCKNFFSLQSHAEKYLGSISTKEKILIINACIQISMKNNSPVFHFNSPIKSLVFETLAIFANLGFLISESEFHKQLKESSEFIDKDISSIVIPTKDRPELLLKCLESYESNLDLFGHNLEFCISDDSNNDATLNALKTYKRKTKRSISYIGKNEKIGLSERIRKEGIPEHLVEFLFQNNRKTYQTGANRNFLLLQTLGKLAVSVDDDTLCETNALKSTEIKVGSTLNPEVVFHKSNLTGYIGDFKNGEIDFLDGCQKLIGKNFYSIFEANERSIFNFEEFDSRLMSSAINSQNKVIVALFGLLGDSGMANPKVLLYNLAKESKAKALSTEELNVNLENRDVFKSAPQSTLVKPGSYMSTFFGFDNTNYFPPYFPIMRDSDTISGYTLKYTHSNSFFGYLPIFLTHSIKMNETYTLSEYDPVKAIFHRDILDAALNQSSIDKLNIAPRKKMKLLGAFLSNFFSQPAHDISLTLKTLADNKILAQINMVEILLSNKGQPKSIKTKLETHLEKYKTLLEKDAYILPYFEETEIFGFDNQIEFMKKVFTDYGNALTYWPEITDLVADLAKNNFDWAYSIT